MFNDTQFNYSIFCIDSAQQLNKNISSDFNKLNAHNKVKRSHLFNGRYENIYIDQNTITSIKPILEFANNCAKHVLNIRQDLDMGFWFNDMPPQSVTFPHSHDDDDELLSGAYYINVPENSGDLVLTKEGQNKVITPDEGQLILFKPDCVHEVTKNNCDKNRLSIGINFGIR